MAEPQATNELHEFISFLFDGLQGTTYVALKNPTPNSEGEYAWTQHYFAWPAESSRMESVIHSAAKDYDVYVSPVVYTKPDARFENVKASNVVWTEFDGNAPLSYENPPSLRIRSSGAANEHVYWRLSEPLYDANALQAVNRAITYSMGADSSAWDATQILRPPGTKNYKYDEPYDVTTILADDISYDLHVFDSIPKPPEPLDADNLPSQIPDIAKVILKYPFPQQAADLFSKPRLELSDRSASLMQLAYFCCEMGMNNAEIFSVLLNADERWKKFANRKDQHKRLAHIITVARHKHPEPKTVEDEPYAFIFNFVDFLNTEIEVDWVIDGMLMENGSMLMVGPSGIGKTQITMRFGMHLALGHDYWHYSIKKPRKILFLSLEMGHGELKKFAETMTKTVDPSDLSLLQENLIVVPHGEKWPLNQKEGQEQLLKILDAIQPDGIFIDSVGSALQGSINNDEHVQDLVDFYDRVRKSYDVFLWNIHHLRKSNNHSNPGPTTQDDVYGNQYLFNRSTSSYGILRGKEGRIKVRNFKNRLAAREEDYIVERTENLDFRKTNEVVDVKLQSITYKKPEEEKGPSAGGGKFEL